MRIARAAAEMFSAQGYHAASMEAIAAKVGISAPALYRHYPNKYQMFAAAVLALGGQLVDCTGFVDAASQTTSEADPQVVLDRAVDALIDAGLRNRESGGLYRWQARYLQAEDRGTLMKQLSVVSRRIHRPLRVLRPALTSAQRWTLSSALLSVCGSVVDHRVDLPPDEIHRVLAGAASALLTAQLPESADVAVGSPRVWRIFARDTGAYEALLDEAMTLFGEQGYSETSVSQIAHTTGVPISGIYRYFSSKADILTTGLQRALDRVSGELSAIARVFPEPHQALTRSIEAYVATSFANPELSMIYFTERVSIPPADQLLLRDAQRSMIDSWVQLLTRVRPGLGATPARLLVHAALALVVDLRRLVRRDPVAGDEQPADGAAYLQACVQRLMECVLLG